MIQLSSPNLAGNEWKYIKDCLDTNWVSSVGSYVTGFEKKMCEFTGAKYAVATSNGTTALHISLMLSGVVANDLVILPNITFIASANSISYCGAQPLLMDVDFDSWQMDLNILETYLRNETEQRNNFCFDKKTGKRISAIMPVHVLGNMCDMDKLMALSEEFNLTMIEDATEALGSYYGGKHSGTFGKFGCFSYNGNKIITTGGGGMIVTDDEELARKAKHLTTQAKVPGIGYFHDEIGYNYRLVNLLAAMGVAQMELLPDFLKTKIRIRTNYNEAFTGLNGFAPQKIGDLIQCNNWLYTCRLPESEKLGDFLREKEIETRPFWTPMNQLPMYKDCLYINQSDVSGEVFSQCISLPCSSHLTVEQQQTVIENVLAFYKS